MKPSQGFWGTGVKGINLRGTGEQSPNFEGNRGTKIIHVLAKKEHKIFCRYLGNRGTSHFISGGTREQDTVPGRTSLVCEKRYIHIELLDNYAFKYV